MMSGEDFGYLKDKEQNRLGIITKKAFLLGAVLFSIVCFVYITINAYYFVYHDKENGVKLIKSPEEPIKIIEENDGVDIKNIDKTIYDSIVGNRKLARDNLNNVKIVKKAITPTAQAEREVIVVDEIPAARRDVKSANDSEIMVYETSEARKRINNPLSDTPKKTPIENSAEDQKMVRGLSRVQLVALTSRDSAINYWSKLNKYHPALFANLDHFISRVSLGSKGTFYRLQVGNFRDQVEAEEFCRKFIFQTGKSKSDCIVVE